ncbi:MAG: 2-oxoglutarate dehydrogenase, E2 component, dihydrolipoamide succinyltransferase, partial [Nitriliruptoraceae bacterium]|nr:2-oxoglutarate dehydrogenase, E2 component, dihydrolipoamide succinyltransferase [Nitriliruptoraceae bacterium]
KRSARPTWPSPDAHCTAEPPRATHTGRPTERDYNPLHHRDQELSVATEVELPQLGESVEEGVITAWLVEVGDTVEVDQPIVEISTDKVDTEIPSPVAGTIQELKAEVDDTIAVGEVIAVIGESDGASSDDTGSDDDGDTDTAADDTDTDHTSASDTSSPQDTSDTAGSGASASSAPSSGGDAGSGGQVVGSKALTSPLVRKLLREAGMTPDQVEGTGPGGRITREDAERAIEQGGTRAGADADTTGSAGGAAASVTPPPAVVQAPGARSRPPASPTQVDFGGERSVTEDLSRVRKAIARSMMESLQTTAQLTAAVEVDLTGIMNLRAARKDDFKAAHGASLSPLPLIARAVCMTLPRHPVMNASMDMDAGTATFHRNINLGIAVDTERGLLVPNIKDAQDLTVPGIASRIGDLAKRSRDKKITPDEISGGTFTITNTGSVGTLFDTPILNPPEVAILATAAVEKRPVVVSDAYGDSIAIRWMSYLCLSYDHRMVDGADAARFLQDLKYVLETHDFANELGV